MLASKLILIEGFPGSGKTTTSEQLGTYIRQQGGACQWYFEEDDPHPILCRDLKLKDLLQKIPPQWSAFAMQTSTEKEITIIESRLWQNTLLFMFMDEYPQEEIIEVHQRVWKELHSLSPVLIYLHQDDVGKAMQRLVTQRSKSALEKDIENTSQYKWFQTRGLSGIEGWVQFFSEWQEIAERLYNDWPYCKIQVTNAHADWKQAYQKMYLFLRENKIQPNIRCT